MLIRSQNKEVLTNLNALAGIEIAEGPVKTVITSYITGCSYLLGEYSNKQKAVKVLDVFTDAAQKFTCSCICADTGSGGTNPEQFCSDGYPGSKCGRTAHWST